MTSLDLHGLTWAEAREEIVRVCNETVDEAFPRTTDVIHGYGASGKGGVLRQAVRTFLRQNGVPFVPGEQHDGNPGHTLVTPMKSLPEAADRLASEIAAFCAKPRTRAEIDAKFHRWPKRDVDAALKALRAAGRITPVRENARPKWRAT